MFSAKNIVQVTLIILAMAALAQAVDETAGPMVIRPTDTFSGTGDLLETTTWLAHNLGPHTLSAPYFWTDIRIRSQNFSTKEIHHSMASDSLGNFYIAWEDNSTSMVYLQVYWSKDDGLTWKPFGYLASLSAELREPSVAVAQGNQNKLLLAYIRDDGVQAVPEVATRALSPGAFSIKSVPVYSSWEGYAKPKIWTDAFQYPGWFAYITCEGIFESAVDNVNICAYRSKTYGDTWVDNNTVFGGSDGDEWVDPDGAFGTTQNRVFLTCYNKSNDFLYKALSKDYGATYETFWVQNFSEIGVPARAVEPVIEASVDTDHVLIACTRANGTKDSIGVAWSPSAGDTFSSVFLVWSSHADPLYAVDLHANPGGSSFHMAYTSYSKVFHTRRPQNLSSAWETPKQVDDADKASNTYPDKGIACNWTTDVPGIVWSDYRDGTGDYDTYFDTPTQRIFEADKTSLSAAAGGTVKFHLHGGTSNGNRKYLIFVGASGTSPGTKLPGGKELPLKWDVLTDVALSATNTPMLANFYAKLDPTGDAMAYMTLPPVPGAAGVEMVFAFALLNPWDFVSNPWKIDFLP